jgi:hypothetical protein
MSSTLKTKIAADNSDNNSIISDKNISRFNEKSPSKT